MIVALLFPGLLRALVVLALLTGGAVVYGAARAYDMPNLPRDQRIMHDLSEVFLANRNCGFHSNNAVLGPYLRRKFDISPSDQTTLGSEAQRLAFYSSQYEERHVGVSQDFCDDVWHRYGTEGFEAPNAMMLD